LVNRWLQDIQHDPSDLWGGAKRVYVWSFYNQGTSADRQVSSEAFMLAAYGFFDLPDPGPISGWEKGQRLASAVRRERVLLVLDGLEPLQEPPRDGGRAGYLRDHGMISLLKTLGSGQPGLCIVTTRLPVADLRGLSPLSHLQIDLEQLDETSGAALFRSLLAPPDASHRQREIVAQTPETELCKATREFGGHALALRLLASYLAERYDGDIRFRKSVGPLLGAGEGAHAHRIMRTYEKWLSGRPELSILKLLGLFDRPAEPGAVAALRNLSFAPRESDSSVEAGGSDQNEKLSPDSQMVSNYVSIESIRHDDWNEALARLRKMGLITVQSDGTLGCHPLVREFFGERFRTENPDEWRDAHSRLFDYFVNLPERYLPTSLSEMQPLFQAVAHGWLAGRCQESFTEVYYNRINRRKHHFLVNALGASDIELHLLSFFFESRWNKPAGTIEPPDRIFALRQAGLALRAHGRLSEAAAPLIAAFEQSKTAPDRNSSINIARHTAQLFLISGNLKTSLHWALEAERLFDERVEMFDRVAALAGIGHVFHQLNEVQQAEAYFSRAKKIHVDAHPHHSSLAGLQGFRYCELLLTQGKFEEALEVSKVPFGRTDDAVFLAAQALASTIRARVLMATDFEGSVKEIQSIISVAMSILRTAGRQELLALGLLVEIEFDRLALQFEVAQRLLDEALELAVRYGMKLFTVDCHLEYARLKLALKRHEVGSIVFSAPNTKLSVSDHVKEASTLVNETRYHRRDREIKELGGSTICH
jgi:tetratricopeptide (TPR) repeat protein